MFIYMLFPIMFFVNDYLHKSSNIFGYFCTFRRLDGFSADNINQSVNYRTKSDSNATLTFDFFVQY